jgi:hypothetical protein
MFVLATASVGEPGGVDPRDWMEKFPAPRRMAPQIL